jgi:hypothetical protein
MNVAFTGGTKPKRNLQHFVPSRERDLGTQRIAAPASQRNTLFSTTLKPRFNHTETKGKESERTYNRGSRSAQLS